MKKAIFTLAIVTIIAGAMITGCQSSRDKTENAKENLKDTKNSLDETIQNLNLAINDSIQQFKKNAEEKKRIFK